MSPELRREPEMHVIGISVRTSNATPGEIGSLWHRFYKEKIAEHVPNALSQDVFSVYFDYESDATGAFQVLIGCAVPPEAAAPVGMEKLKIEASKYAIFDASGAQPEAIQQTWATIWNSSLRRSFRTDFERHQPDGRVTVYVGVI